VIRLGRLIGALTIALALVLPAGADAAFPGANGKINFTRNPGGAYFMNPDGSVQTPASVWGIWSPDASRFLRSCNNAICVYGADGTFEQENYYAADVLGMGWSPDGTSFVHGEQTCGDICYPARIVYEGYPSGPSAEVTAQDDLEPAWSPDGRRIAFVTFRNDPRQLCPDCGPPAPGSTELYVTNADGTGQLRLTNSPGSEGGPTGLGIDDNDGESIPSWSPDGTRIAIASNRDGNWEIYVVNADGSGSQRLTNNSATDLRPRWSPDGTKIAFQTNRDGNQEIYSMNPNGTGQTNLTNNAADDVLYDWLTVPIKGYPRPRGASPSEIFLVPAYAQCIPPGNRTHGAPLAFPSCAPPAQTSGQLTVGTPDANGQPPKSVARIFFAAHPGDLALTATITDVRKKSDLSDYAGELSLVSDLRITDKNNTPNPGGPGPGTVQDMSLPITISCSPTADATVGSSCNLSTTIDALHPGAIAAGQRAIWQLGQVKAFDGGPDGDAETTGGNTLFMNQGLFVP
jgi:hypothetical protein